MRRMIASVKAVLKKHWPKLRLRTILLGVLLFVAGLPGVGAIFLRVYENTLVRQTEAERLGLPPEKYETWKQIEVVFDPRGAQLR